MIGPVTIRDALRATANTAELLDRVTSQMARAFDVRDISPVTMRWTMQADERSIVADGTNAETRITADDLARLPEAELRRLFLIERSFQNHFEDWMRVFPKLEAPCEPSVAAQCRQWLREIAVDMVPDIEALSSSLRQTGVPAGRSFERVEQLFRSVGEGSRRSTWTAHVKRTTDTRLR